MRTGHVFGQWQSIDLVEITKHSLCDDGVLHESGYPPPQTNVNGGAIVLDHPLDAPGVKLMNTLLHKLAHRQLRYGLQTMREGRGQG